ncbi:MAG: aspartyl/glutamyl-tRNA amidotransferase subunit C [Candidatus Coatesbacteria bacterium]|nr:MAG: aspartyl/glutamyl-tRNA amidotransferase subunit C [Candidatus Coatesbacteria bacterium]
MGEYDTIVRMVREARLALQPDEVEELARQVVALLENVDVLASIEVDEGAERPAVGPEALRADAPGETLPGDEAVENAPDSGDGYVAVPRVVTGSDDG